MKKHIIWTSDIEDDFVQEIADDYGETMENAYCMASEINYDYLDDEREMLNVFIGTGIIAIADIGRWNGRVMGYKEIGNCIADCLYTECPIATWYVDERGRFKGELIHHDGTNHVEYRAWKGGVTDNQRNNLLDKIYMGRASRRDITRYTRSLGKYIAEVYGWAI